MLYWEFFSNKKQSATWKGYNSYSLTIVIFLLLRYYPHRPHRKPYKTNNKKLRPILSEFQVCNLHAADQSPLSGSFWCPNNGRILFVEISSVIIGMFAQIPFEIRLPSNGVALQMFVWLIAWSLLIEKITSMAVRRIKKYVEIPEKK